MNVYQSSDSCFYTLLIFFWCGVSCLGVLPSSLRAQQKFCKCFAVTADSLWFEDSQCSDRLTTSGSPSGMLLAVPRMACRQIKWHLVKICSRSCETTCSNSHIWSDFKSSLNWSAADITHPVLTWVYTMKQFAIVPVPQVNTLQCLLLGLT